MFGSDSSGFLGGGQVGVNWQTGSWVLGIEGDFSWTDASDTVLALSAVPVAGTTVSATGHFNWFATVTGRVGYAWDNWLAYVKGGVAWTNVEFSGTNVVPGVGTFVVDTFSDTRVGWTVGAGLERAFAGNWSWKVEYNYMNFGTTGYATTTTPASGVTTLEHELDAHAVKFGINYRLGRI